MALSWHHELDGRCWQSPRDPLDLLAGRIYFAALTVRALRAIDAGDAADMRELLGVANKGDLQNLVILGVDLIDAYCRATGATFAEVRRVVGV